MTENLGRADIEKKMFEGMHENRGLPCRRKEMVKGDGEKRGAMQGSAKAGEAGWQATHADFVIKALEFKMTGTSIGLNDGNQEGSNIAPWRRRPSASCKLENNHFDITVPFITDTRCNLLDRRGRRTKRKEGRCAQRHLRARERVPRTDRTCSATCWSPAQRGLLNGRRRL